MKVITESEMNFGEFDESNGDDDFKGNGPKTLQWLMNDLIPSRIVCFMDSI